MKNIRRFDDNEKTKDSIYLRINSAVCRHKALPEIIRGMSLVTTAAIYIFFLFMLLYITDFGRSIGFDLLKTLAVCASDFLLVTLIRKLIDRKRPYTVYGYEPVIPRKRNAGSMPSRHVFSVFMIAFAAYQMGVLWFAALIAAGVLTAVLRVVGGVHYVSDVVAAFLIAAAFGVPAFIVF